jgi:FolB domain-containing protein
MSEDRIEIKDLLVRGILGVNDWERQQEQDILINLTLYADLNLAGASDSLEDTVNYRTLTKQVISHVRTSQRYTVEALAADIARISLEQPGALRFARSVGVEIERSAE